MESEPKIFDVAFLCEIRGRARKEERQRHEQ